VPVLFTVYESEVYVERKRIIDIGAYNLEK
jgi:hypothetical protein